MQVAEIVRVKFRWPGKVYEFLNPQNLALKRDDLVLVESYKGGTMVGKVVVAPRQRMAKNEDSELTNVIRIASDQDMQLDQVGDEFRSEVKRFFETRLRAYNLTGVKFVDCEKADGGRKLIIYYNSEQKRFEPRAFAIEIANKYGVRVDLRGVGVRDAARLAGGIGRCGLSMCCSTWLPDFESVSIKMAKDQGLALDPEGLNGQCGRLLCCLGYEHQNYLEMGKDLPKVGKIVVSPIGDARVVKLDILKGRVSVRNEEGQYEVFDAKDVKRKFAPQNQAKGQAGRNSTDESDDEGED